MLARTVMQVKGHKMKLKDEMKFGAQRWSWFVRSYTEQKVFHLLPFPLHTLSCAYAHTLHSPACGSV